MNQTNEAGAPYLRSLQVYSFDPNLETNLDASTIKQTVLQIPWEELSLGPVGEYIEVIDIDPASQCAYDPVDLDDPHILATDGLAPSDGVPQFHQQMVYAVAMKTIDSFERALGRPVLWHDRRYPDSNRLKEFCDWKERYVARLRIYPHAFRGENAYYSRQKAALLFGYFNSRAATAEHDLPGAMVFTCSSHDIIAHETTHAILDGMHRLLLHASNPDMLALHEAFGDIVAIFQHFTLPGVVQHQIQSTGGDLALNSLLTRLAIQFGYATRSGDALRNALGEFDPVTNRRLPPDPDELAHTDGPHERGAILVAAMFDAFLETYNRCAADLMRLAGYGRQVPLAGNLHPDLVGRLAREAVTVAERLLRSAIAALDYLPPVDVTFGDFLRALITADMDLYPVDSTPLRLAIVEGFRRRGIVPRDVRSLSVEALVLRPPEAEYSKQINYSVSKFRQALQDMAWDRVTLTEADKCDNLVEPTNRSSNRQTEQMRTSVQERLTQLEMEYFDAKNKKQTHQLRTIRREISHLRMAVNCSTMWNWINDLVVEGENDPTIDNILAQVFGLDANGARNDFDDVSTIEIHAVRVRYQRRSDGRVRPEVVMVLTQYRDLTEENVLTDETLNLRLREKLHRYLSEWKSLGITGIRIRGGCTVIIDPDDGSVRYAVSKNILSEERIERTVAFHDQRLTEEGLGSILRYDFIPPDSTSGSPQQFAFEPCAALHGCYHES